MRYSGVLEKAKSGAMNRNGFAFLTAVFMVMMIGVLSAFTFKSWTAIMKREREKELLFRGSQIKEAIENWYNPKYFIPGVPPRTQIRPLMDLRELLLDSRSPVPVRYLPQTYETKLDDKNPKCEPDCPELKIYQDPMTGGKWEIIKGSYQIGSQKGAMGAMGVAVQGNAVQVTGIIGIASKSEEEPFKMDFTDTALENMGSGVIQAAAANTGGTVAATVTTVNDLSTAARPKGAGGKLMKYSEWKFIADPKNDHSKIYRAYHEGW